MSYVSVSFPFQKIIQLDMNNTLVFDSSYKVVISFSQYTSALSSFRFTISSYVSNFLKILSFIYQRHYPLHTASMTLHYTQCLTPSSWWSQSGSNRRHPACKAGALPAELWPLLSSSTSSGFLPVGFSLPFVSLLSP